VSAEPSFRSFGRYALLGFSGAGGMGRLDIALAAGGAGLTRLCVLKRMHPDLEEPDQEKRFLREAKIALGLSHGAIAQTLDVDEVDGELCILQELVHGASLGEFERRAASREPLPLPITLHIVREVARALAYAHAYGGKGVVHRDVAPDNVMLAYTGEVKLVDFGIAKSLGGETTALTAVGHVVGRPMYTAPEVRAGAPASAASDLYSLGVVLWQLLTGRSFPDPVPAGGPALPSRLNPAVSPEVDAVVRRAVASTPEARFPSATALGEALARLLPPGFVGDREIAKLLAAHFPVEEERRALAEKVARAQAELFARKLSSLADASLAPGAPSPSPAPSRPRSAGNRRLLGLGIAAAAAGCASLLLLLTLRPDPVPSTEEPAPIPPSTIAAPSPPKAAPTTPPRRDPSSIPAALPPPVSAEVAASPRDSRASRPSRFASPTAVSDPRVSDDLIRQSESKLRSGDLDGALSSARQATRNGGGERAHLMLGRVLFAQGRLDLAEREFADVVRRRPRDAEAARYLANVRKELGKTAPP
jgi:serine/threonine-protein kinase